MIPNFVTGLTLAILSSSLFVSCQRTEAARATPAAAVSREPADQASACAAQRAFESMDKRAIVPLLPHMALHQKQNMREHLQAVQEIVLGLASDDFAAIERAGARLGSSPQMTQMCTHMGSGAPGFSERALSFHHTADSIGVAARARDRGAVTTALGSTLRACTSCHEAFQQRVVEASVFPHGAH